jgi:hypothetical protein
MFIPLQNVITLGTQERQKITIAAQDIRLVLDPRRQVRLIQHLALRNDGIRELNRCAIQEHHVDEVGT